MNKSPAADLVAGMQLSEAPTEQVLWCVHVIGPDDLYAFPTLAAAQENAKALAAFMDRQPKTAHDPICIPVVTVWPHSPESHAADIRENVFSAALPPAPGAAGLTPVEAELWKVAMDAFNDASSKVTSGEIAHATDAWQRVVDRVLAAAAPSLHLPVATIVEAVEAQPNQWDHIDDVIKVLQLARAGKWGWGENMECKYVEVRIDMRDGGCIIKDRHGKRISPQYLERQPFGIKHMSWAESAESMGTIRKPACQPASTECPTCMGDFRKCVAESAAAPKGELQDAPSERASRAELEGLRADALDIFDGPECSQTVRDAIEWYHSSVTVALDRAPSAAKVEPASAEKALAQQGVFKGAEGLRKLAECQAFWDQQPYGTRLYFGDGGADYLHRGVLQSAIAALDSAPAPLQGAALTAEPPTEATTPGSSPA